MLTFMTAAILLGLEPGASQSKHDSRPFHSVPHGVGLKTNAQCPVHQEGEGGETSGILTGVGIGEISAGKCVFFLTGPPAVSSFRGSPLFASTKKQKELRR